MSDFIQAFFYYKRFNARLIKTMETMDAIASEIGKEIHTPVAPINLLNTKDNGRMITS